MSDQPNWRQDAQKLVENLLKAKMVTSASVHPVRRHAEVDRKLFESNVKVIFKDPKELKLRQERDQVNALLPTSGDWVPKQEVNELDELKEPKDCNGDPKEWPSTRPSDEEVETLAYLIKHNLTKHAACLYLGGTKYRFCKQDEDTIFLEDIIWPKFEKKSGIVAVRTDHVVIVGRYDTTTTNSQEVSGEVESAARKLRNAGF